MSRTPANLKVASKLSIREAMAAGWQLFRTKFWTCFWMLILAGFVVCIPHLLIFFFCSFVHQGPLLNLILLVLYPVDILTVVIVSLGTFHVLLRLLDDQDVGAHHLFSKAGKLLPFLFAGMFCSVAVSAGLFLFIVPGIMLAIMLQFYPYLIVDQNAGPIQALKASAAITSGAKWKLLLLAMILSFVQGISICLWFTLVAPFLGMMYVFLTVTCAYRLLLMNTDAEKLPFPIVTVAGSQVSNSHQAKDDLQSRTYTADSTESTRQSDFGSDSNAPPGTESPKELSIADRAEMMDIGDGQPFSTAVPEKEPLEHRKDDSQESKNNLG